MSKRDENLRFAIKAQHALGMKGDNWDNYAIARETLQGDLGYEGGSKASYNLDTDTRDILIAHARQDAAHALCNTTSLLGRVQVLTRLVYLLIVICLGLCVLLLYKLQ